MEISEAEYERLVHRSRLMDVAQDLLTVVKPDGTFVDVNAATARYHGITRDELVGRNCNDFLGPESAAALARVAVPLANGGADGSDAVNLVRTDENGEDVHFELRVSWSEEQGLFYVVERDVTDRHRQLERLMWLTEETRLLARTDALTNICNRMAFDEALEMVEDLDSDGWLALVDIDYFKNINDTYGHGTGDEVLVEVADRLETISSKDGGMVARIGGDEFALLSKNGNVHSFLDKLCTLEEQLNDELTLDRGLVLPLSCSIGSARRRRGDSSGIWLRRADGVLYRVNRRHHAAA